MTTMRHWRLFIVVLLGCMICLRASDPMGETDGIMASLMSMATFEAKNAENIVSRKAETANYSLPKLTKEDDMYEKLIEWIRSHKDGIVSEKLEIRRADPKDAASGHAIFIKESIKKGELLYSIPWDLIITPDDGSYQATAFSCATTRTLIQEAKKGKESYFYPYLRVFEEWDRYKAPLIEDWTEPGKNLLETVTGTRLPPRDWRDDEGYWMFEWLNFCDGDSDALSEKALMFVETRAEDALLVPLYDMTNHVNGDAVNVLLDIRSFQYFNAVADRDIEAGEQVSHSYNLCPACGNRITSGYGTPQLFRDYGFVEQYPQRWDFHGAVRFDLTIKPDTELEVVWVDGLYPTRRGSLVLEEEKDRLEQVVSRFDDRTKDLSLPTHEYETSKRYLNALYTAVYSACAAMQMDLDDEESKENDKSNIQGLEDDIYEKLIEWIRSHKDGIVSEKLEIRRADPKDAASGHAIFIKESVKKGELLYSIPWDLIITPDDGSKDTCATTRTLIREAKKGKDSSFYSYLRVFEQWDPYKAPLIEDWTEPGKDLLETITGTRLPPQNVRHDMFEWYNCEGVDDALSEKALSFVETRGEDELLVPLYDMTNHANGDAVNVLLDIRSFQYFNAVADRDIEAGEQVNHSYNLCPTCGSRIREGYGTPQLFRDYGFVEQYPQRWDFHGAVRFDLMIKSDTKLEVVWIDGIYPTRRGQLVLEEEKDRLEQVVSWFDDRTEDLSLPTHEYETCKRYLNALYTAVYSARAAMQMDLDDEESKENLKSNIREKIVRTWGKAITYMFKRRKASSSMDG
eukprot:scaffold421305_cov50-Attheya_sp.AAC.1